MAELKEGDIAPGFTLPTTGGGVLSLADLRGRDVILYFYPKDDTSGCTKEASNFRDSIDTIHASNAMVLGVSPDNVDSHDRFARKFNLPFTLLADMDHRVAEAYGAWGEKTNYGKSYQGIRRNTYLIGPDGVIRKIWTNVKADRHISDVLAAIAPS